MEQCCQNCMTGINQPDFVICCRDENVKKNNYVCDHWNEKNVEESHEMPTDIFPEYR